MNYRVIKGNQLFFLTDEAGEIPVNHPFGPGLYWRDTRYLSRFNLRLNQEELVLLSSDAENGSVGEILLTNPHMERKLHDGTKELVLWREAVEIRRSRWIVDDVLYEEIKATNYHPEKVAFELNLDLDADFQDMFMVRGFLDGETGIVRKPVVHEQGMELGYEGADDVTRRLIVSWNRKPSAFSGEGNVTFPIALQHGESVDLNLTIVPQEGEHLLEAAPLEESRIKLDVAIDQWQGKMTSVKTNHEGFGRMIDRGLNDLRVLLTDLGYGPFPVAGLPWFAVPFGRDSIITALQLLPFEPDVALGTLRTMAAYQGTKKDSWRDEEPGKIMHEIRFGELAQTGQIPFTPYYGTIDATPLFLVLLSEYVKWTGNTDIMKELDANVVAALKWIDEYGDRDGSGFVSYHQEAEKGIANQGWKDSADSIVHRDGTYGESPISLSEVQGYVYQAKAGLAELYETFGKTELAVTLRHEAAQLKQHFEEAFWMPEQGYYALALDKNHKQVGTITSNPGHVLLSGMLEADHEKAVSAMLASEIMFSGYGIRTMGEGEAGYNPMSYHNGTVWPHDNALSVLGMSKTGNQIEATHVMNGLIRSAASFEYDRLPELFCGHPATRGKVVPYPIACSPQAWAAGTPLMMMQAMLGLFPDAIRGTIHLNPALPEGVDWLEVRSLKIAEGELDVDVSRVKGHMQVEIVKNTTGLRIVEMN